MKYILIFIFAIYLIFKSIPQLKVCNINAAKMAIPPRIFFDSTIDGRAQHVLVTRFFHNKIGIFSNELGRCYFGTIEPYYLFNALGFIGLAAWLFAMFEFTLSKRWKILVIILLLPLIPFIQFGYWKIIPYTHKAISVAGFILFLKRHEK